MATFEEKWQEFKNNLTRLVPDWNTQFLNWADARGFGFGGGFFNEFPHTHTYETDLSWLISRMKWVLFRMDSVEERMSAVEALLVDFIESMDIPQLIKDEIERLIEELKNSGFFDEIVNRIIDPVLKDLELLIDTSKNVWQATNTYTGDKFKISKMSIETIGNIAFIGYTCRLTENPNFATVINTEPIFKALKNSNGLSGYDYLNAKRQLIDPSGSYAVRAIVGGQLVTPANYTDQINVPPLIFNTLFASDVVSDRFKGSVIIARGSILVNQDVRGATILPIT